MTKNQTNLEDYSITPVPANKRKSTFNISITSCAWIISLSTIFTGGALVAGMNFRDAVLAAVFGMLTLAIIGFFQGWMGAKYGVSTTMLTRQVFGRYGANLFGVLLALTMGIGWFGWQIAFFGMTIAEMFPDLWFAQPKLAMVWGGILMMLTAFIGYRGLAALSMIAVPLVSILSIWGLTAAVNHLGSWNSLFTAESTGESISLFTGITIVVGNAAAGAIVFADVTRYGKTPTKGGFGSSIGYFLGGVFCVIAGAAMTLAAQVPSIGSTPNIPAAMSQIGLGFFAFLILVFAQWTTNDNNLYTGSLGLRNVVNMPKTVIVAVLGILGLAIALIGIQDYFVPFLNALGTYVPPIAGVMIADHWIVKPKILRKSYQFGTGTTYAKWNIAAIAATVLAGWISSQIIWGITAINAIVIGFALYIVLAFILNKLNISFEIGEKSEEANGF
ncbi:purine-cytosine permease family protein [Gracilibacillus alcaliphilus]|uniref:purine-cytosine permease family protein n=1 Tax=Gracilibacillus alcaliphilus TaxID=1401441 RepID=UPI00195B103D|nr:cytosine permease [Gracilibacillus alcaliphilus]MBM7679252.1 cytosine permease [Gracilibacillus alcaliphilus]